MTDNVLVKLRKPIQLGRLASLLLSPLFIPLMFIGAAISIPYGKIHRRNMTRREDRFAEAMKLSGRVIDWADFVRELDRGNGMLIVERFSFKGPIRFWWTRDDLYKTCPYPLVTWFTLAQDTEFDPVREWCNAKYTGITGESMLVSGTKDQWRTIRGDKPLEFRESPDFVN